MIEYILYIFLLIINYYDLKISDLKSIDYNNLPTYNDFNNFDDF